MSPLLKLLLIVAVAVLVWWVVTSVRASRGSTGTTFTPVDELDPEVQQTIDAALSRAAGIN